MICKNMASIQRLSYSSILRTAFYFTFITNFHLKSFRFLTFSVNTFTLLYFI